jgi:hypothetical protein
MVGDLGPGLLKGMEGGELSTVEFAHERHVGCIHGPSPSRLKLALDGTEVVEGSVRPTCRMTGFRLGEEDGQALSIFVGHPGITFVETGDAGTIDMRCCIQHV